MTALCIIFVLSVLFLVWCVLRTARDPEEDMLLGQRRKSYGNPQPPRFLRSLDRDGNLVAGEWEPEIERDRRNP